ncbi:MAG: hypothetical protein ACKOAX_11760, partial [Candidatus Kapaibacterium sp.]
LFFFSFGDRPTTSDADGTTGGTMHNDADVSGEVPEELSKDGASVRGERLPVVTTDALQHAARLFGDEDMERAHDELQRYVQEQVVALLTKNPERLMSILYRIDVPEDRVRDVMMKEPVGGIATKLTALLLERMEQKMQTRRRYRDERDRSRDDDPTIS